MLKRFLVLIFVVQFACSGEEDPPPDETEDKALTLITEEYADGALLSVWSSGADDVWVVGGEQGHPVVLHFDGSDWERNDPPVDQQLWWVHGFSSGEVFVAGEAGAIARYDGSTWQAFDTGFEGTTFYGIWGSSPNDVWAVGGPHQGTPPENQVGDVVLHFNGSDWTRVSVPYLEAKPASAQKNLFKVWGANATDVFIVGDSGLTLHYDGTDWNHVNSGITGVTLFTVIGRTANDVYAVGGFGAPALIHWDGTAWEEIEVPLTAPSIIQGIWTAPGEAVYLGGQNGFFASYENGEWTEEEPVTNQVYHAVWGDGAGSIWASGGNIVSFSPDYDGVLAVRGRDLGTMELP